MALPSLACCDRANIAVQQHPGTLLDARRSIRTEISALQDVIRTFEMKLSAFSPPTSVLPPELLGLCFSFLAEIDPPGLGRTAFHNPHSRTYASRLGWIHVTHVCRRWRYVALNQTSLWRELVFELGPDCASAMLERAKCTPLHIYRSFGDPDVIWYENRITTSIVQDAISEHITHLRTLNLQDATYSEHEVISSLVQAAPILSSVKISTGPRADYSSFSFPD